MSVSALEIVRIGGPRSIAQVQRRSAPLSPGHVRIRVKAAGVNFADLQMRQGLYPEAPPIPFVPGYEVAGEVLEIDDSIRVQAERQGIVLGARVVALCSFGGYQSEVVLPLIQVLPIPARLSFAQAAALPVQGLTAWVALHEMARVRLGDRVVITSAAGGVGLLALELAKRAGAVTLALTTSPQKLPALLEAGSTHAILQDQFMRGELPESFQQADIILDSIGGAFTKTALKRCATGGRVVTFGVSSLVEGDRRSIRKLLGFVMSTLLLTPVRLMMSNVGIFGLNMLKYSEQDPLSIQRCFQSLLAVVADEAFPIHIDSQFPVEKVLEAHDRLQMRKNVGKVILIF